MGKSKGPMNNITLYNLTHKSITLLSESDYV